MNDFMVWYNSVGWIVASAIGFVAGWSMNMRLRGKNANVFYYFKTLIMYAIASVVTISIVYLIWEKI